MLFDTSAWIEYVIGSDEGAQVKEWLEGTAVAYTCPVVLAELQSKLTRQGDARVDERLRLVRQPTAVIEDTAEIGIEAGRIHAEERARQPDFGMADAFILACARSRRVRVLTKDPHFASVRDADDLPDCPLRETSATFR